MLEEEEKSYPYEGEIDEILFEEYYEETYEEAD
jgi:hypothetical protein